MVTLVGDVPCEKVNASRSGRRRGSDDGHEDEPTTYKKVDLSSCES